MKWTYIITRKIKAAAALLVVFVLVLAINLFDKYHFDELQESFTSVYQDRLVAEAYLFNLSKYLQEKKQLLQRPDGYRSSRYASINDSIQQIIQRYRATKLTAEESKYFLSLQHHLKALSEIEKNRYARHSNHAERRNYDIEQKFRLIWLDLESLSEIQLSEGKRIMTNSQKVIASSNMAARLEIGILVIIGLIIQALIFSSKSLIPRIRQQSHMN